MDSLGKMNGTAHGGQVKRCVGFVAAQRISLGLANPGADAGFVATEFLGKLNGFTSNTDQLDHLLAKLGRIRPSSLNHKELL